MEAWTKHKLGNIIEIIGGGTPKTSVKDFWNGSIPWLSVKDFNNDNRYVYKTEKFISEKGLTHSSTQMLHRNDIIISARGTVGEIALLSTPMAFNQSCYGIRGKEEVDQIFLYYLIKNNIRKLKKITHGSVFDTITRNSFNEVDVILPDLKKQKKIATFLSAIDNKIELNQKINENLEEQTLTLFKSWFIDFIPFSKKIPDNWRSCVLGDLVEIKRGGSPRPIQKYLAKEGLHWLKISDATAIKTPYIFNIKEYIKESGLKKTVFLKAGALVLSNSATPGIPKILGVDSCIHDGWLYFPHSELSIEYLYLLFKIIHRRLVLLANGSVFTNLKTEILKNYPIICPDRTILDRFTKLIRPIFQQIFMRSQEIILLSQLRETILPKLMSNELDISDIDF